MNGKGYFHEIKKEICLHRLFSKLHNYFSTESPRISIHFRQRCTSFWNPSQASHLVFCHSNLLAPFLHLWTALPSVLLYLHQHTDHHKRLWISIGGTFSASKNSVTARCLNRTSENSSISMCTGEKCKHLCSRWSMMEERYHATTQNRFYPDVSNVNQNITVEAKLISPPT